MSILFLPAKTDVYYSLTARFRRQAGQAKKTDVYYSLTARFRRQAGQANHLGDYGLANRRGVICRGTSVSLSKSLLALR